jgi:hypothetical protein
VSPRPARKLRCAVYTRKSSEEGLEQEFNSLHAQREAGLAYIASQKSEGWIALPDHYDDGGISGGTLERPALQRLLRDIEVGLIDVVVVYKIDRLSRSLTDFAKLVDVFERRNVTFVSVTQQFNTTTSMGRLWAYLTSRTNSSVYERLGAPALLCDLARSVQLVGDQKPRARLGESIEDPSNDRGFALDDHEAPVLDLVAEQRPTAEWMCSLSRARPPTSKTTAIGSTFWRRARQASLNSWLLGDVSRERRASERESPPGSATPSSASPAALQSSTYPSHRSQKSMRRGDRRLRFDRALPRWHAADGHTARGSRWARADGVGGSPGIRR